ncbi:TIGR02757 family protein [Sinomicrobium soli]|uniref:TIGR02757 family protein n=1 Tax=Sinomicrobium sp. N-1-3-6 TaxID=2219864 RepID=UPI000DCE04D5|nr:TIGR02757 family protein [Sinomicrobium sp. N-1-3-6]RAV29798.1 TIGR02757 family protein [Sinomicrobium sp. N-1-3-6]
MLNDTELREFLDLKAAEYNNTGFITTDPIQIPHGFSSREDIEIAGFLSATIAWGNRKSIITNARKMMELMGNAPHDFVMSHNEEQLGRLDRFVHRTFNGTDLQGFVRSLHHIYSEYGGMEPVFAQYAEAHSLQKAIHRFKMHFFEIPHEKRTEKHVSDPLKGSSAKRINMFLRWMVRQDHTGVDFGIWKKLSPRQLSCPLDIHTGNIARKLGLLKRKQNDAKALAELDNNLRKMDPEDPVKYDFALFGLGAFEKF